MSHTWALIPVKSPEHSKTRLASVLQPQECANLSRAMFMDVLAAMQVTEEIERGAVRLTLGRENTEAEIDTAAKMMIDAYQKFRGSSCDR